MSLAASRATQNFIAGDAETFTGDADAPLDAPVLMPTRQERAMPADAAYHGHFVTVSRARLRL